MTLDLDKNLKKEIGVVRYSASNSSKCVFKLESELKFCFWFLFLVFVLCLVLLVFMECLLFVLSVLCCDVMFAYHSDQGVRFMLCESSL